MVQANGARMTTTLRCPCCAHCAPAADFDEIEKFDEIAEESARIVAWCRNNGAAILRGDLVRQIDAARLLDRAQKTLQNWAGGVIPVQRLRGRAYYRVLDLAVFIVANREN